MLRPAITLLLLATLLVPPCHSLEGPSTILRPILPRHGSSSMHNDPSSVTPKKTCGLRLALALRGGTNNATPGVSMSAAKLELDPITILSYSVAALLAGMTVALVRKVPRSGGNAPDKVRGVLPFLSQRTVTGLFHLAYFLHAAAVIWIMPDSVKELIFSPGGVMLLGTFFPTVESIRAAVTDTASDDLVWLQYWIMHGVFSYGTEMFDKIADKYPFLGKHWYAFEFYMILWLILPFTDGADIVYERLTRPYLVPMVQPIAKLCEGWLTTLALSLVNASHLWFVGIIFMALPVVLKRFAVIVVGTVFPVLATTIAVSAKDDKGDQNDTRWLTYWACFSLLYLCMHAAEKYVGNAPGLYTLCMAMTLYLMLPIFNGSEAVFRKILVPLFRQREALLLKDARTLARTMVKQLPKERHEIARQAAAAAFLEETNKGVSSN